MGITLGMFRKLFIDKGNVLNHFWLFDKSEKYIRTICADDSTKFDEVSIVNTYMHMDESDEIPVLCICLDM